jgi:hypothetical protein
VRRKADVPSTGKSSNSSSSSSIAGACVVAALAVSAGSTSAFEVGWSFDVGFVAIVTDFVLDVKGDWRLRKEGRGVCEVVIVGGGGW